MGAFQDGLPARNGKRSGGMLQVVRDEAEHPRLEVDAQDLIKNFAIDTWYKAVMYLGGIIFVVSLFSSVKGLTNSQLQLLSGGAFLLGLGEWKNHNVISGFKRPNAYTGPAAYMEATVRSVDFFGILFGAVGTVLILLAIWRILRGR